MDQATLVGPDVSVGNEVLDILDGAGIKPVLALLGVFPEYGDWRLILSSPALDQTHLLKAHRKVSEALHGRAPFDRPIIMILPLKDPFVREMRRLFGKTKDVSRMRLGGQTIGNRFLEDAYVYRIK